MEESLAGPGQKGVPHLHGSVCCRSQKKTKRGRGYLMEIDWSQLHLDCSLLFSHFHLLDSINKIFIFIFFIYFIDLFFFYLMRNDFPFNIFTK